MLMPSQSPIAERHPAARIPTCRQANAQYAPPDAGPHPLARTLDVLLATLLLLVTWPLLLVGIFVVRLSSPGSVFYSQTRLGRRGKPFQIYKIRTMHNDCERISGPAWSANGDPRVFRVGRLLRRTHIDELPQLWNIMRGDMSLVGPRPERPEFVPQLERVLPCYRQRLDVQPGLTGLAQVHLPPDSDLESVRRKLAFDLYYIRRRALWLDLRILAATVFKLVLLIFVPHRLLGFPTQVTVDDDYRRLSAALSMNR
jgi:lipopolysaccharide/colanic/teichoic acid biosynthesis glycosyltransferase